MFTVIHPVLGIVGPCRCLEQWVPLELIGKRLSSHFCMATAAHTFWDVHLRHSSSYLSCPSKRS